jgi:hypothetical protein
VRAFSGLSALIVLVGVIVVAGEPAAAEVLRDDVTLATYTAPKYDDPMRQITLAGVSISVAAGQHTYVSGVVYFANASGVTLVDASVQCVNGTGSAGKVVHGENIFPASASDQHSVAVTARLLADSTISGALSCTLYAFVRSLGVNTTTFSITAGHIEIGRRSVPGGVHAGSTQQLSSVGNPVWTPTITGTATLPGYTNLWRAPAGATTLNVITTLSLTTCKKNGDSFGCPGYDGRSGSTVRTTLFVTQFNSNGTLCQPSYTDAKDTVITDAQHHDVAYHQIPDVKILTTGTCVPIFSIYMKTQVLSGRPATTHDPAPGGEMGVVLVLPA